MASILKRVSPATEAAITTIADRESRSFVAQLDRVVAAGLAAMGEDVPEAIAPDATTAPKAPTKRRTRATAKAGS